MTSNKKLPQVALIGRTNVGKSTIFNRLTEEKGAIVSKIPGTTRDRKDGECRWNGRSFKLTDTAGLDVSTVEKIDKEAVRAAKSTAQNSALNLLVVDGKQGILPQDKEYAKMLRGLNVPFFLVINKVDGPKQIAEVNDFLTLGIKDWEMISAVTGAGTGDLLDKILKILKTKAPKTKESKLKKIDIAIIGKPNVGKSSLLNKIAGEERSIVSSVAHTTRDSQDFGIETDYQGEKVLLNFIDTAGIRKQRKIDNAIEEESVEQSLNAIRRADLTLLMLDANEDITMQDKNISREILERSQSLIFVVNKWDLVKDKDEHSDKKFIDHVYAHFPYLTWAPVVFLSAKTGFKINRLVDLILEVYTKQHLEIAQTELNDFLKYIIKRQSPRKTKGTKPPFIHQIRQINTAPQTFEIITNQPENIHFSYLRFIKNNLRERYQLAGVGIKLVITDVAKIKGKVYLNK